MEPKHDESRHAEWTDGVTARPVATSTPRIPWARGPEASDRSGARIWIRRLEVALVSTHPEYPARTALSPEVRRELLGDLEGTTKPLDMS